MNVFATDHPLNSEPLSFSKRLRRCSLFSMLAYPVYLLLLGPLYSSDGHGYLAFAPERVRVIFCLPAVPVYVAFGPHNLYDDYLSLWYKDPNEAETTW
jgi:hypothetical protein